MTDVMEKEEGRRGGEEREMWVTGLSSHLIEVHMYIYVSVCISVYDMCACMY